MVLFEPRIPPNTGNIARTCAAFQLPLALIEPLGFTINDRTLKRAGLDYWPHVQLSIHPDLTDLLRLIPRPYRLIGCSRHGGDSLSTFRFCKETCCCSDEDTAAACSEPVIGSSIPMPGGVDADGQGR